MAVSKEEVEARANELGLTVTRADGRTDIEPTVADYQEAIAVAEGATEPEQRVTVTKSYVVAGPFPVLGVQRDGELTGELDADGVLHVEGGGYVVVGPALAQGAIIEKREE